MDHRTLLLAASILLLAFLASAEEACGPQAELEEQVWALRLQGDYDQAADLAGQLIEIYNDAPDTWLKPFDVARTTGLRQKLEYVARLPVEQRREVAKADSLSRATKELWRAGGLDRALECSERAARIYERILGSSSADLADALRDQAGLHIKMGDFGRAEDLHRQRVGIWRLALDDSDPTLAVHLNNFGQFLAEQRGKLTEAEDAYREALSIYERTVGRDNPGAAMTLLNLANLLLRRGAVDEADPLYAEAADICLLDESDESGFLFVMNLRARAAIRAGRGDLAGAESFLRESLSAAQDLLGMDASLAIDALDDLARIRAAQGDMADAEGFAREALRVSRDALGDDHPDVGAALDRLGLVLKARGDYAGAEPLVRRALAIRRTTLGPEHPEVAMSLNNVAALLESQGDLLGAEELMRESLEIRRALHTEDTREFALALGNLGVVVGKRGDHSRAEELMREALSIYLDVDPSEAVGCLHNLAGLKWLEGDYEATESLINETLELRREIGSEDLHESAALTFGLASVRFARGDYEDARVLGQEAIDVWRQLPGHESQLASGLQSLGKLHLLNREYADAESVLVESARLYEVARSRAGAGLARATFTELAPYPVLAVTLAAAGRSNAAWEAAERGRGRVLADLLLDWAEVHPGDRSDARQDSIQAVIQQLELRLDALQRADDASSAASGRAEDVLGELLGARATLSELQHETAETRAGGAGAYALERVQGVLDARTAIVGWVDVPIGDVTLESWAYVVRESGPVCWEKLQQEARAAPSGSLTAEDLRSFRRSIGNPNSPAIALDRYSRVAWADRFKPLEGHLDGVDALVVIGSGGVQGLPLEAFRDDEGTLIGERYAISYALSATLYTWISERAPALHGSGPARGLLLGDAPFSLAHLAAMEAEAASAHVQPAAVDTLPSASVLRSALGGNREAVAALPRLPASREEVESLARLLPASEILLGRRATEEELVRLRESGALRDLDVIHIATHAISDDEQPGRSALVLSGVQLADPLEAAMSGTRLYDGLVTAAEISSEWELECDLVTLSACETALGKRVRGEGPIGLAHAFLQSGARSLLVSLWKVDDAATSRLMRRFYEDWLGKYEAQRLGLVGEPMTKAAALREAKLWLRGYTDESGGRPYEHPYYWSAFILIGDRS